MKIKKYEKIQRTLGWDWKWDRVTGGKEGKYVKDIMKIKFETDNDLPLNQQIKFPTIAMVARSVFEEDGKFYPQIYLDECLYEL